MSPTRRDVITPPPTIVQSIGRQQVSLSRSEDVHNSCNTVDLQDFAIAARSDGTGSISFWSLVPVGDNVERREIAIDLNAATFRPVWEAVFAHHYEIVAAHLTTSTAGYNGPVKGVRSYRRGRPDAATLTQTPHQLDPRGFLRQRCHESGFSFIANTDLARDKHGELDSQRYAVVVRAAEPHWPAWVEVDAA